MRCCLVPPLGHQQGDGSHSQEHEAPSARPARAGDEGGHAPCDQGHPGALDQAGRQGQAGDLALVEAADQINNNNQLFYMLANQLPLIALSESNSKNKDKVVSTGVKAFIDQRNEHQMKSSQQSPWIIAITDPNDLLSYPVLHDLRNANKNTYLVDYP